MKTISNSKTLREEVLMFRVNEVEGLVDNLDKDFSVWSDFD